MPRKSIPEKMISLLKKTIKFTDSFYGLMQSFCTIISGMYS